MNSELYGGESPTSVVTLGMNRVWCDGVHPAGEPGAASTGGSATGSAATGSVVHGTALGVWSCDRTGELAASIAAGLVEVWSTIGLLISRGCESMTMLFASFCF